MTIQMRSTNPAAFEAVALFAGAAKSFYHRIVDDLKSVIVGDKLEIFDSILTKDFIKSILVPAGYGSKRNVLANKIQKESVANGIMVTVGQASELLQEIFKVLRSLDIDMEMYLKYAEQFNTGS